MLVNPDLTTLREAFGKEGTGRHQFISESD